MVDATNRFMLIGVKDADTLAALRPDQTALETISKHLDSDRQPCVAPNGIEATTRVLAPLYGIP